MTTMNAPELALEVSRVINAPKERLFNAWLDPDMLRRFMTPGPGMTVPAASTEPREGGRFDIVGDDFVGPRQHNQVTQQEFEEIARVYSDIRLGRGDLTMDTSEMPADQAAAYRQGVMDDIGTMMTASRLMSPIGTSSARFSLTLSTHWGTWMLRAASAI